ENEDQILDQPSIEINGWNGNKGRSYLYGLPLLDPVTDMEIDDDAFKEILLRIQLVERELQTKTEYHTNEMKTAQIQAQERYIAKSKKMILEDELIAMTAVLKRYQLLDSSGLVTNKGRCGCEINSVNEIIMTELLFSGLFNQLDEPQIVSLLSCMLLQDKSDESTNVRDEMVVSLRQLQEKSLEVGQVCKECKMQVEAEEFVNGVRPGLVEAAYQWTKGLKFFDICKLTDVFEGSIVRCLRRVDELLEQLQIAAKAMGTTELVEKFKEASSKIRRDIVFAASLYL
ncbi:MAG: putative DExH-box ATP-dependent RNA helicase DExH10, partial [Streblomastix strix]